MVVALFYIDKIGHVKECFLGIAHDVTNTNALSLKEAIKSISPNIDWVYQD